MNHYETLFVVKPTLTDEETQSQIEKTLAIITDNGGEIVATDSMGMRKLAYPVEKNERGFYTVVYYKAPGTLIAELERQMRYNEEILKFMTVKYTKKKEIAQFEKMAAAASKKAEEPAQESEPAAPAASEEA
jgi:small subunit ribosomal protein S6